MGTNELKEENELKSSYENTIFKKIEQILGGKISIGDLVSMNEKKGFRMTIDNILDKYSDTKKLAIFIISEVDSNIFKKHKELHTDMNIVKLAIQKNSSLFYYITSELKKDIEIGKEVIKSMIRENKNFYNVELFINTYFIKENKKLFDAYFEYLDKANIYYISDLSKNLFSLKKSNNPLYDILHTNKLFTTNGKNIIVNNDFIKQFVVEISKDEGFKNLTQKEKDVFIILKLGAYFNISKNSLSQEEKVIFDLILNLINIEISNKIKETKKKEEEQEKPQPGISSPSKEKEASDLNNDDEFNDFADFSYPECNSYRVTGGYNIETITGKKIFITNTEKDNFTTKALKNYIKFYNTLYNLGLNFLWDKYSNDFKILCNNKIGFDYMHSEGITDSKMLSILNMIGRNVGIPEYTVLNDKGEETNQVKCFKTLGDAKEAFSEIKETGIIKGTKYSDGSTFGNGAVENRLIEVLCIDQKGHGLNISKWR